MIPYRRSAAADESGLPQQAIPFPSPTPSPPHPLDRRLAHLRRQTRDTGIVTRGLISPPHDPASPKLDCSALCFRIVLSRARDWVSACVKVDSAAGVAVARALGSPAGERFLPSEGRFLPSEGRPAPLASPPAGVPTSQSAPSARAARAGGRSAGDDGGRERRNERADLSRGGYDRRTLDVHAAVIAYRILEATASVHVFPLG